jgi:hypothetical protein
MILPLIIIIFCIICTITKKKDEMHIIHKSVLNRNLCENVIKVSKKYELDDYMDEVDGKPANQIDIYDDDESNPVLNKELWDICKNIYDVHIKKYQPKPPGYIFLRKYTPDERFSLPIHLDENKTTVSFLISSKKDCEGGELYLFDRKTSRENRRVNFETSRGKQEFLNKFKKLPIVDYDQGDMISYSGDHHLHGVLPVTKGFRYAMCFFFD